MDIVIKLNEQTVGRDKIIRLLQYGSRAYWYYAQNIRSTQHSAEILRSLEYTFSSFRKLLRLGRCLDSLYSALKMMKYPDVGLRLTLTLSKIANALFLLADHIIWIGRVGLHRVNIEKWSKVSNKYWLMSIIMNLIRDFYEILKILEREGKDVLMSRPKFSSCSWKQYELLFHLRNHKAIVMDAIKNACDLFIPLTALGFTKFTPGAIGIFGMISSIVGIYTLIYPLYKVTPA
ncbi:Peroxisomal membrane protein 11B [Habropoda laboriosa]|uniref:Peroxisomal membrane protein 11B n=1 Tax=Habropoda laboriosa TaxID=597456 RepID=A0A0L7R9I6_9HYME|nr:PREDICTED: peroxisomal membrane protein 11B [Habropoda laboriosa]KOC67523.1 Peroxisomal membrane protein 11B [Habropoda laboriosa]